MSWGNCNSGSNNIHFDFPPIMADGRNYASWQPGALINTKIRQSQGITTNSQYRKYLTENADKIINLNQLESCDQCCSCPARNDNNIPNTPFLYKSCSANVKPYGYENSDLKENYISQYQLQCRMTTPVLTQAELLQHGYLNYN